MKTILLFSLFLLPVNTFAASLQYLQERDLDKIAMSDYHDSDDATLMNIHYVGDSTECAVAITLDNFLTYTPIGTADLDIDMSAAAYDTLGEVCDYINADADYECTLVDGKRDDDSSLTTNITAATTTDAKAAGGYYLVGIDSGSAISDGSEEYITRLGITPASGRRVVLKYCNVETDGTGTLLVYGKLAKYAGATDGVTRNDSTLVIGSIVTANDTAEANGNIYGGDWLEFAKDEHVVISGGNVATDQSSTALLECFWDEK